MSKSELLALAERVESAKGPDTQIDVDIFWEAIWEGQGDERIALAYTASLDAAMTLIGADAYWRLGNDGDGPDPADFKATVTSDTANGGLLFNDSVAATPALALCAASIRARAQEAEA